MSRPIISVENLSKAYRIGVKEEIPDTMFGAITGMLKAPFRNFKRLRSLDTFGKGVGDQVPGDSEARKTSSPDTRHPTPETSSDLLWALRDVSFDIHEGEVVGIIGGNGAGKSTLLKILSRITEPTSGRVVIRGRVSSLLEVGTGFHPELTGRENIYMNGTILGMRKKEIDRKFDEIVDFSGVERFLDTPIKRYSSGMSVRLAFAVAAHLEPEILIIDEVLAVGDAEFQKKCLGKMQDVAAAGRTVLFVSHNMPAVKNLCSRAIRLRDGRLAFVGSTNEAIEQYLSSGPLGLSSRNLSDPELKRKGTGTVRFEFAEAVTLNGEAISALPMGEGFRLRMQLLAQETVSNVVIGIGIFDSGGMRVCGLNSQHTARWTFSISANQSALYCCELNNVNLGPGIYRFNLQLKRSLGNQVLDAIENALTLEIAATDVYGTGHVAAGNNVIFLHPRWLGEPDSKLISSAVSNGETIVRENYGE